MHHLQQQHHIAALFPDAASNVHDACDTFGYPVLLFAHARCSAGEPGQMPMCHKLHRIARGNYASTLHTQHPHFQMKQRNGHLRCWTEQTCGAFAHRHTAQCV